MVEQLVPLIGDRETLLDELQNLQKTVSVPTVGQQTDVEHVKAENVDYDIPSESEDTEGEKEKSLYCLGRS